MFQSVARALLVLLLSSYTQCQRRIVNGERIDKSYVVYIIWDLSDEELNKFQDTTTICGGVFLNSGLVLTAASCLAMFPIQYVIGGYNKYVPDGIGRNQEETDCLDIAKKPIVEKFYRDYRNHTIEHGWQYNDLGIARLETAYDFNDVSFVEKCSYQPTVANPQYREIEPGANVVIFGWGSKRYHRPENLTFDINEDQLRVAATKIIEIEECDDKYYMLTNTYDSRFCTSGEASVDIYGIPLTIRRSNPDNYTKREPLYALDVPGLPGNETIVLTKSSRNATRRNGACQNDHGGPIVTWENGTEIVIGVITGYLVNKNMECVNPSIYTALLQYEKFITSIMDEFPTF